MSEEKVIDKSQKPEEKVAEAIQEAEGKEADKMEIVQEENKNDKESQSAGKKSTVRKEGLD
jgi:hypothetical protein